MAEGRERVTGQQPTWPADFVARITALHGPTGQAWLDGLPGAVADAERRWDLRVGSLVAAGYSALFAASRADGTTALLKAAFPAQREIRREGCVLTAADGAGLIRLYEHDYRAGLLVLEQAVPGEPLAVLAATDDEAATRIAAAVMRQVWAAPVDETLPTVTEMIPDLRYYRRLAGLAGPVPTELLDRAEQLLADLWSSADQHVLLHGDLHHGNIVSARRAPWLCIDPKGYVGDPAFEAGAFLINPLDTVRDHPDLAGLLARRLDVLATEFGIAEERLAAWAYVRAVVSEVWSVLDDGEVHGGPLRVAQALTGRS